MKEPERMCLSTFQLQLMCIPEPRVLPCPGARRLLGELWMKGIGEASVFPSSNMALATP